LIKNSEIKLIVQGEGELNILNNSFYLDPSDVIVNGESKPNCKKSCEFINGLNNVTIKFDNQIESCEYMFDGIVSIIEVDLSNFDASKVISMHRMFSDCINLKKITFGSINTSLVQNMEELFNMCTNLTTIDRLDFDTLSVKTMKRMLSLCLAIAPIWLSAQTFDFDLTKPQPVYNDETGYGYDVLPAPDKKKPTEPFYFSVKVPDGNYRVKVVLGGKKNSNTTVRAEGRRLLPRRQHACRRAGAGERRLPRRRDGMRRRRLQTKSGARQISRGAESRLSRNGERIKMFEMTNGGSDDSVR
jgi:hypothetical protein